MPRVLTDEQRRRAQDPRHLYLAGRRLRRTGGPVAGSAEALERWLKENKVRPALAREARRGWLEQEQKENNAG